MNFEKIGGNVPKNNEPEDPSRRRFLKAAIAGAAVLAGGGVINNENGVNTLYKRFEGKEGDSALMNEAAVQLLDFLNQEEIESVRLVSGPGMGFGSERVDIPRDFLTKSIQSPSWSNHELKNEIISEGKYTRENLIKILSATTQG